MAGIPIPFVGSAYTLDSVNVDAQRCLNWYPEVNTSNSKAVVTLQPTPGLKLFATLNGGGSVRGLYTTSNNRFFGVCGNILNEMLADGTVISRGTLTTSDGIVRMSDNGIDMIIVDGAGGLGFTYTLGSDTFTQITDANYPGGTHVAFVDQYYLVNKPNTQQYYWSALADGTTWGALQVASAEGSPDNINSMITLGSEVWIFGPQSFEVIYNTGDANATFSRIPGTHNDIGNVAPDSLARSDSNIFWLGGDDGGHGRVFVNEGYRPRRISTHAIEQTIQKYSKIDDAIGYCYQQQGHEFYVISFPAARTTWVFDLVTGMWHERSWTNSNNVSYMHRGIVQDFFNGEVYVGDWGDSSVYELDPYTYTDNGAEIHRIRTSPHIWNNMDRLFFASFQLDLEPGIGLISGQGEDPQIMLQWSNDGGHTWSSEKWRDAGKLGEYSKRVIWRRLGQTRDRVFRVKVTDPVKWVLINAFVEVK